MESRINKWGNSAAVRIPAGVLASMRLDVNSPITIEVAEGKIVIAPLNDDMKRRNLPFSEEALVKDLNAHNAHADEVEASGAAEFGFE